MKKEDSILLNNYFVDNNDKLYNKFKARVLEKNILTSWMMYS